MSFIYPEISILTLRDISYLVAIVEYGGFRKAAGACAVSQPALSVQVKKLEDTFGFEIFERSGNKVVPTQAGKLIIAQCRTLLDELEELGRIVRGVDPPLSGPFRLGVISSLSSYLMPYLLDPLRSQFPNLILELVEGVTSELLDYLRVGQIEAAITSEPPQSGRLLAFDLFEEPLVLMLSKDHPLNEKSQITLDDLEFPYLYTLNDVDCLTQHVVGLFARSERQTASARPFGRSLEGLRLMVAHSKMYAIVPQLAANFESSINEHLNFRRIDAEGLKRRVSLVLRPNYASSKSLARFREVVATASSKLNL